MDVSQGSPESTSPSRNNRSSIPIPKRKSSLHLYIANSFGNNSQSSPSPSSASSVHEDPNSASSSRSATAMGMHSSMYVPGRTAAMSAAVDAVSSSDYLQLKENHNRLINKCEEVTRRNQNLESTNQLLKKSVTALQKDVAALRKERSEFVDKNRKLKKKLAEIVPSGTISNCSDDDEGADKSLEEHKKDDSVDAGEAAKKESELDSLLNEMEKLKSYLNNVELQLYEANEKISELQESKQQYEETSEKLRAENAELSKIARLMSANILESIDTSKRLETSYIQVRRERDNLARQNRDSVDSRTDPTEEIQKMRSEMELKRKTFEAQFIEYKNQMEQELLRQTDERVVSLQLEVDNLKQDLAEALDRAERAEEEARELRTLLRASQLHQNQQFYSQLDLDKLSLHDLGGGDNDSLTSGISYTASAAPPPPPPPLPPPPPPPPPMMAIPGTASGSGTGTLGLSEAISTQKLNHVGINPVNSKQQATGLDSVIADIKSGRVTLRRRKPNVLSELESAASSTKTSPNSRQSHQQQPNYSQLAAKNPALREMYEILERMKRRNRQSKVIVESEIVGGGPGQASSSAGGGGDATDGRTVRTVITGIVDL